MAQVFARSLVVFVLFFGNVVAATASPLNSSSFSSQPQAQASARERWYMAGSTCVPTSETIVNGYATGLGDVSFNAMQLGLLEFDCGVFRKDLIAKGLFEWVVVLFGGLGPGCEISATLWGTKGHSAPASLGSFSFSGPGQGYIFDIKDFTPYRAYFVRVTLNRDSLDCNPKFIEASMHYWDMN